jgi:alpha-ketoglutarate-dependent taurine dioxygenase
VRGADVEGADLSGKISADTVDAIKKAWADHLVLRFRGQQLDDDQLMRFSAHFGELDLAPVIAAARVETAEDSERLLDELWRHATRPELAWYQQWRVGDLVMWDNRCALHRRDEFDPQSRRLMHRTQIKGDRPF